MEVPARAKAALLRGEVYWEKEVEGQLLSATQKKIKGEKGREMLEKLALLAVNLYMYTKFPVMKFGDEKCKR